MKGCIPLRPLVWGQGLCHLLDWVSLSLKLPTAQRGHVLPAERLVAPENNIDFFCELQETTSQ